MSQTSMYMRFYQSKPAYRYANTNLKTSQLFQNLVIPKSQHLQNKTCVSIQIYTIHDQTT